MQNLDLKQELLNQVKAELGEDGLEKNGYNENKYITMNDETKMLYQKYGLVEPQLTASEKRLIQREERKNAGK